MNYSRILDGVRGVAILLVLLFHFHYTLGIGWAGVQLFFVLSGYLITSILLKEKSLPLAFYLKRFYWRRTLRIFPLYYAYIFMAGIAFLLSGLPKDFLSLLPFLATYTFNFYPLVKIYSYEDYFFMHFWSLSIEEQFYFVWPLVIFLCSRKQLQVILLLVIAGAPVVRFVLAEILTSGGYSDPYVGETVYRFTLSQWDGFAFGAMIPVFSLQDRKIHAGRILLLTLALLLGLGLWNAWTLMQRGTAVLPSSLGYQIGAIVNYQHVWSYSLLNLLFFSLIVFVLNPPAKGRKIVDGVMGNSFIVYLGKISYGLYVYHWIVAMAFNKYLKDWFPQEWLGLLVYLITGIAIASLSYFIYERPILSLKDKYFSSASLSR